MRDAPRERLALEPVPRVDQPWRRRRTGRGTPGRAQLHRQPEPVVREPPRVVPLRGLRDPVQDVLDAQVRVLLVPCMVELEADAMHGVRLGRSEPLLEAGRVVGGILAARKRDDAHLECLRHRQLHPAQRRLLAGGVRVEAEEEPLRQPLELTQLVLGERSPHRGDDGSETRLAQRDHVRVSLDDERPVLLRHRTRAPD